VTGEGAPLDLRISDLEPYSNNSGVLHVEIYRGYLTMTGEGGAYSFDLPLGTWYLAEQHQHPWQEMQPGGFWTVSGASTGRDFGNRLEQSQEPMENTAELCADQKDNDGDELVDLADPDCAPFVPRVQSGGGSGWYGGGSGFVLGESTSTEGQGMPPTGGEVLGASTTEPICTAADYLTDYLWYGRPNNPEQVNLLQAFLNEKEGNTLPVSGYFGSLTLNAVKTFQSKYASEILAPWGITEPTGNVYKSTKWKINILMCPASSLVFPQIP
jgi:hypothetical protein